MRGKKMSDVNNAGDMQATKELTSKPLDDDLKKQLLATGDYVSKEKLTRFEIEANQLKQQNEELTKQLESIAKNQSLSEELKMALEKQLSEVKQQSEAVKLTTKKAMVKKDLQKHDPYCEDDILTYIKLDEILIHDDGTVIGLSEQIEKIKKEKSYLFKTVIPEGVATQPKPTGTEVDTDNAVLKELRAKAGLK